MKRRVVITGLGMVTPLGTGVEKNWESLCAGKSVIGPVTKFDASDYKSRIAAEVTDFNATDFLAINTDQIVWILPTDEIINIGD